MTRYVAFLRAINTPGRNVKMARLRSIFESMGFDSVDTFIASGNVIFDADDDDPAELIETTLEAELGFATKVFLRTAEQVIAVSDLRPFGDALTDYEVSFLPSEPDPAAVARLLDTVPDGDQLAVLGREVYWRSALPPGDSGHREGTVVKTLGVLTTRRGIRTVRRITDRHLR